MEAIIQDLQTPSTVINQTVNPSNQAFWGIVYLIPSQRGITPSTWIADARSRAWGCFRLPGTCARRDYWRGWSPRPPPPGLRSLGPGTMGFGWILDGRIWVWVWGKGIKAPKMNGATVQLVRYKYCKKWCGSILYFWLIPYPYEVLHSCEYILLWICTRHVDSLSPCNLMSHSQSIEPCLPCFLTRSQNPNHPCSAKFHMYTIASSSNASLFLWSQQFQRHQEVVWHPNVPFPDKENQIRSKRAWQKLILTNKKGTVWRKCAFRSSRIYGAMSRFLWEWKP